MEIDIFKRVVGEKVIVLGNTFCPHVDLLPFVEKTVMVFGRLSRW